jgi:hypothetical protein
VEEELYTWKQCSEFHKYTIPFKPLTLASLRVSTLLQVLEDGLRLTAMLSVARKGLTSRKLLSEI